MKQFFVILAIMIILPLICKKRENNNPNNAETIFCFRKSIRYLFFICMTIMLIISIVFLFIGIHNKDDNCIGAIFFAIFSLFWLFIYLLIKNKKIIYKDDIFYVYNMFNNLKEYYAKEIIKAVEYEGKGMILTFNNKSKIKIDLQMENYSQIKSILKKYNIEYTDQNGNISPKSW